MGSDSARSRDSLRDLSPDRGGNEKGAGGGGGHVSSFRLTEPGDHRITEAGDRRILD